MFGPTLDDCMAMLLLVLFELLFPFFCSTALPPLAAVGTWNPVGVIKEGCNCITGCTGMAPLANPTAGPEADDVIFDWGTGAPVEG